MNEIGKASQYLLNIILADDDEDDCFLFKEALGELNLHADLKIVHSGKELIELLAKQPRLICDVLFLDLNMPVKNGFECLEEIKLNKNSNKLTVVILSTSLDKNIADQLYKKGANFYIRKPSVFSQLKNVIQQVMSIVGNKKALHPSRERFVISYNPDINNKT